MTNDIANIKKLIKDADEKRLSVVKTMQAFMNAGKGIDASKCVELHAQLVDAGTEIDDALALLDAIGEK